MDVDDGGMQMKKSIFVGILCFFATATNAFAATVGEKEYLSDYPNLASINCTEKMRKQNTASQQSGSSSGSSSAKAAR